MRLCFLLSTSCEIVIVVDILCETLVVYSHYVVVSACLMYSSCTIFCDKKVTLLLFPVKLS